VTAKLLVVTCSRALSHVLVMYQAQYGPDAEVDKPHRCQKYRQFAAFSDLEHVQIHSDQHQAKADEHPGSNNLNSHFSERLQTIQSDNGFIYDCELCRLLLSQS
jgi:hypothetical protein